MWNAPWGYKFILNDQNKSVLAPTERGEFIKEAYRLAETGMSHVDICAELKKKGCKITPKLVGRILTNPLYCGLILVSWLPDYIQAIHEPVITQEQFFRVAAILRGDKPKKRRDKENDDFPLRGLIWCDECQTRLTAGWSKGNGGRYPYYFCRCNCGLTIRRDTANRK